MNIDTIELRIERLQASYMHHLNKLHIAVYNKALPSDYFTKKYHTAFTGISYVGYLAFDKQDVAVAFYGVIPCFLQHNNQTILAAQSADTMTHPLYRNKGLFVQLANLTFNLCRANGIKIIFGFPNQNSLPGFLNKLGWQHTDTMDCFIIPANWFNWEKHLKKIPLLKKLYNSYCSYILKKHIVKGNGLPNQLPKQGYSGVHRDANYLAYKKYHTTYVVKVNNALIWLKINNGLIIGDICLATENFHEVISTVKNLAKKLGLKQVQFHSSPGTLLHQLFKDHYQSLPSFPVIFKDMGSGLQFNQIKFTTADIDTF